MRNRAVASKKKSNDVSPLLGRSPNISIAVVRDVAEEPARQMH